MENNNDQHDAMRKLRTLLKSAGYVSCRMSSNRRAMFFSGKTREWNIVARANETWLNIYTVVCTVPDTPGMRARLLEETMRINQQMFVTKFVLGETTLALELDYRAEHVDVEAIRGLIGLVFSSARRRDAR